MNAGGKILLLTILLEWGGGNNYIMSKEYECENCGTTICESCLDHVCPNCGAVLKNDNEDKNKKKDEAYASNIK